MAIFASRRGFIKDLASLGGQAGAFTLVAPSMRHVALADDTAQWIGVYNGWAEANPPAVVGSGRVFWVSNDGNNRNPGTRSKPFRDINHVINATFGLVPGDTVIIRPGTYQEQVFMAEGGDADIPGRYVTLRSEIPHQARLRPPAGAYSTLNLTASHVIIDGFDAVGGAGHAIQCEGSYHHVQITNNRCHSSGGSGISCAYGEYYRIEGNVCYANCATNEYHTSGISIFRAINVIGVESTISYRNVVRNNICYNNVELSVVTQHTDGNGIIIDDFHGNHGNGALYPFRTLVENNLCFSNGGKGIQVYLSDHVMVRNNTCYHNNTDPLNPGVWRAEISNANASDNRYINNICVCDPSRNRNNSAIGHNEVRYLNRDVVWRNNLTFCGHDGVQSVDMSGSGSNPSLADGRSFGNLFGRDPQFVAPLPDQRDYRLRKDSPARNAGTTAYGLPLLDLDGAPRMHGSSVDLGCYEAL